MVWIWGFSYAVASRVKNWFWIRSNVTAVVRPTERKRSTAAKTNGRVCNEPPETMTFLIPTEMIL